MKAISKFFLASGLASSLIVCKPVQCTPSETVPAELRQLAARAGEKDTQARLRRWAASAESLERRGLAYFVVGYREYAAGEYLAAAEDLRQAASTHFSLADFAEYFWGVAAIETAQYAGAIEALDGFSARHPQSTLHVDALALFARALLQTDQAERATQALLADPRVRQLPSLAALLAQAYRQTPKLIEAARAYQEVYFVYAASPEAKTAEDALEELRAQLGSEFPIPTEELQTARPDAFFNKSRFTEAQKEYGFLLQANPSSGLAGRWRVQRGRCLLRLKRSRDAVELLTSPVAGNPTADGDRLAALVEGYIQQSDAASMASALEQLKMQYPQSQSYASALFSVGNFFVRQGDWVDALRYYEPLAQQFPERDSGREGHWRVAWGYHLQRQADPARRYLLEHVSRYPMSPHIPAALYWLARLAEEQGTSPTARVLYEFLTRRYPRSYYALQAGARLKGGIGQKASAAQPELAAPDPVVLDLMQRIPPAAAPPIQPCASVPASESLGPFETLQALSLSDLAGTYLKDTLAEHADSPGLYHAASRAEAEAGRNSLAILDAKKLAPNPAEYEFSALPKEIWSLLYPTPFWDLVRRQARVSQLDPYLVMGLIRQESTFNPGAISSANARGLMQLLPKTAARVARRRRGVGSRIYDPAYNIRLGCAYFAGLLKMFGGSAEQALAAYNAGDFRVRVWLNQRQYSEPAEFAETIPFRETRIYVQAVLRDAEVYRQLLTGTAKFAACEAGGTRRGEAAAQ